MWPFRRVEARPDPLITVLVEMVKAQQAQTAVLQSYFDQFKVSEAPVLREFDEAADMERYLQRVSGAAGGSASGSASDKAALPAELRNLDLPAQFRTILDRLDAD